MLPIVLDLIKQSFVSLFSELGRSWIRGAIILETNTTTDKSLDALFVRGSGETPPSWWGVQQLGDSNTFVNVIQRYVIHAMITKNFENIHRLTAFADGVADMLADS